MPDRGHPHQDDLTPHGPTPDTPGGEDARDEGGAVVLPAVAPARPRPGAHLALRRHGAVPQIREAVARLARNPVAVTTALVGAGLAVRLAPAALGREVLRATPVALPARPSSAEPAVVRHVVHHVVHVVVHVRPAPPPGLL